MVNDQRVDLKVIAEVLLIGKVRVLATQHQIGADHQGQARVRVEEIGRELRVGIEKEEKRSVIEVLPLPDPIAVRVKAIQEGDPRQIVQCRRSRRREKKNLQTT